MSIPVIASNHPELGYSTDNTVVMMRHGMKMAFPDDDIVTTNGENLTNEGAEPLAANLDAIGEMVETVIEEREFLDHVRRRGMSRSELPQLKQIMGEAYPSTVPDEIYSTTPSRNGICLVQEGFVAVVAEKFKQAMATVWEVIQKLWRFVCTKIKEAWDRLIQRIFYSRKFIHTYRDIQAEVKAALGEQEYAEVEARMAKDLTVEGIYAALNDRGKEINQDILTDTKLIDQCRVLAACAKDLSDKLPSLFSVYSGIVSAATEVGGQMETVDGILRGKIEELQSAAEAHAKSFIDRLSDAGIKGLDSGNLFVTYNTVAEFFRRQSEAENHQKVYRAEKWVGRFKEAVEKGEFVLDAMDADGDMQAVIARANDVLAAIGKTDIKDLNPEFQNVVERLPLLANYLMALSRTVILVSRKVTDYHLLLQQGRDLIARYESLRLERMLIILDSDNRWKFAVGRIRAKAKKLSDDAKSKLGEKKEYFSSQDDNLVAGKDLKFLSFKDEVAEGDDVYETIEITQRDVTEINEVLYRSRCRDEISSPDEATYRELRQRYLPHRPSEVTLEGFGVLKLAIIGAAFVALYKLIERVVRWIRDLISRRKGSAASIERKVETIDKTEEENRSAAAPTEEMVRKLDETKPNKEMLKAAGMGESTGFGSSNHNEEVDKPISLQVKMQAVAAALEDVRKELLKTPQWSRFQDAATSLTVGYFQDQRLENIVRLIRSQRPERVAYLVDQCRELDLALKEHQSCTTGEVGPRLARIWETLQQGRNAYRNLYDATHQFVYDDLSAGAYLPAYTFAAFGRRLFENAQPVYPTEETMEQLRGQLKTSNFLVFAQASDEVNNLALKRFGEMEQQFKKIRDVANQVKSVPENIASTLNDIVTDISAQVNELAAWYSFEESLRIRIEELVDAMEAVVKTKADIIDKRLTTIGLKGWTKK